eukprot:CAMPEP_0171692136 /NCGR_PEP_ID=MMETSP0991-20121206/5911_1 /TAXON_ID=483369 /ORGANISM="non described non described, Strain CCMP2098" /LENGTH=49 /DNA_ID= /DNA_START= /DNA_END= /DNA_ORIENTATION=
MASSTDATWAILWSVVVGFAVATACEEEGADAATGLEQFGRGAARMVSW